MWSLGAGINNRQKKKQNPSHTFSSFLPSPIAQSRADRRRCSLPFQRMPVDPGQLPLVALDQDVGFVSGPTVAFRVYVLGCVHLSFFFPDYN